MSQPMRVFLRVLAPLTAAGAAAIGLIWVALRPWYTRWGATNDELRRALPGDQLIARPHPLSVRTKAITIAAPAARVWPWLVQLGQGRGGLYSYEWLENLLGMEMHNADRIRPEWQHIQVGDLVRMGPDGKAPPPFVVALIDPGRVLVIGHRNQHDTGWHDTYTFVLEPIDAHSTRLIHRSRAQALFSFDRALEPGYFIMERGMLLGIKQRAERNQGTALLAPGDA